MIKTRVLLPHDWFPRALPSNVAIGQRSWCYSSYAFLHYQSRRPRGVTIGNDTGIYNGTFFDLGPEGEVEIGNYCTLVGAVFSVNTRVVIGDYAFIAHEVVLADSFAARPCTAPNGKPTGSPHGLRPSAIVLGENSWIGARAVLLSGARVGEGAIVGAAAVVDFEVPPYMVAGGNPGRIVGRAKRREDCACANF
jgi:acetyltransferase-like isoleucine patch superfamily enzyme